MTDLPSNISDPRPNLLILRHGETNGNAQRIVQTPETELNELGKHQARLAAHRILGEHGSKLVIRTSDYARARQTAEALAKISETRAVEDQLLRERNLGEIRGHSYAELGFDPFAADYHPPSGESWNQFFSRVAELWAVLPRHLDALPEGHTLVLVTHGLVCRALAHNHLNPLPGNDPGDTEPPSGLATHWPNTSLTKLRYSGGSWKIITMNCDRHLATVGDPKSGIV